MAAETYMILRAAVIAVAAVGFAGGAAAQPANTLGEEGKALIGTWEFSNADRDKICTAIFKNEHAPGGFKVEFDKNCVNLFPLVGDIVAWTFPDNDLLRLIDAHGKTLVEFSEVESGIYEAPTPGVGVLFLQNAADAAGPPAAKPDQVAGNWAIVRGETVLCSLTLATTAVREGFTVTVKPGCDAAIARMNFSSWRLDRGELVIEAARGNPWRFEEMDESSWRRLPETDDTMLVRTNPLGSSPDNGG